MAVESFAVSSQQVGAPSAGTSPHTVSRLRVRSFQSTRSRGYKPPAEVYHRPKPSGKWSNSKAARWIAPYNNGLNSPVYSVDSLKADKLLQLPIQVRHSYDTCIKRNWEPQTTERSTYSNALLGIVVVVCNENIRWLGRIPGGCDDKHIYIYAKCGGQSRTKPIKAMLAPVLACTTIKVVSHTIITDLAYPKMHADYLRHMIARYDELEPSLLFLKASVGLKKRRNVMSQNTGNKHQATSSLASFVETALTGEWAFLGIWPHRVHNSFRKLQSRGREMCELYKRFTCEEECYSCAQVNHPVCYIPQSKSMFMVSRSRIRSLPHTEYVAMLQWLMSYKDTFSGWFAHRRRYVMERVWPVMFGCDQDAHRYPSNYANPPGCREDMVFGNKTAHTATTVAPPQDFIDRGHVTWPQPSYLSQMPYFPHVFTWDPAVTLVTVLDNPEHMSAIKYSLMSALLTNPDIKLTLLIDHSAPEQGSLDPVFWTGRVTMMRIRIPAPPIAARDSMHWLGDWKVTAMQAEYLKRASSGPTLVRENTGHIVFVRPHTIVARSLRDVFQSTPFTLGVSMQPVEANNLDLSAWFVHMDHVAAAAAVMGRVVERYQGSQALALKLALSSCFQGADRISGDRVNKATNFSLRPAEVTNERWSLEEDQQEEDGGSEEIDEGLTWSSEDKSCRLTNDTEVTLRFLPCKIFNVDRSDCPPDHKAKVASIIRGRDSSMMSGMWAALQIRNRASTKKLFSHL